MTDLESHQTEHAHAPSHLSPDTVRRTIASDRFNAGHISACSVTDPYLDFIEQTLKQYPSLPATRLHQMLLTLGYAQRLAHAAAQQARSFLPPLDSAS
jgi:hypothetical protein